MTAKKLLPIGFSEFRRLMEDNYYYIDKTKMIEELLQTGAMVTLITRPRRFGKTLNMTMLREFFSMDVDSKNIFSELKIMDTDYASEINKYPVLFFSFKDAKGSKDDIVQTIKSELRREFAKYLFLRASFEEIELRIFEKILERLQDSFVDELIILNKAIHFLCQIVFEHHKIRPILLIDEYDTPMISAYENNCYDELRSFFTNLYSSALKDNPSLNFAVLTGIQRVSKENIFSGLNNIKVCTVMDKKYNDKFGLTKEETSEFLNYYGLTLNDKVAAMYNGYNFSGQEIFNPWSIINYADTEELQHFWVNTSSNKFIYDLMKTINFDITDIFEKLVTNGKASLAVDLATSFFEMKNEANFWGLLVNAGYLTLDKKAKILGMNNYYRIPNGEVKGEFKKLSATYVRQEPSSFEKMFTALLERDLKTFTTTYKKMLLNSISFYDRKENAYHMLFLGMSFYLYDRYNIKSNREVGDGRADIVYTAKYAGEPHLVVEIKYEDTDKELVLKNLSLLALTQIKEKNYYAELSGDILLVGVAHAKKDVEIVAELISKD